MFLSQRLNFAESIFCVGNIKNFSLLQIGSLISARKCPAWDLGSVYESAAKALGLQIQIDF